MKLFSALLALASSPVNDCNTSSIFRPTALDLTPNPPVIGQPTRLTVQFINPGPTVTDGTVTTSVTLNYLPFSPTVEPLCKNTACPLVTGPNDRSTSSVWPDVRGVVTTQSVWNSLSGDNLLCVKTSVKVASALRYSPKTLPPLFRDDLSQKQVAVWTRKYPMCNVSHSP